MASYAATGHLQADWQNRDQLRNPTLGNRVWATFTFLILQLSTRSGMVWSWSYTWNISQSNNACSVVKALAVMHHISCDV